MIYKKSDIITKRNIKFKDSNKLDCRINGHPVVVLLDLNHESEMVYFLKMSGSFSSTESLSACFPIKPDKDNKLRKASYADLRYVYKSIYENIFSRANLSLQCFNLMIMRLKTYQSALPDKDDFYSEIKSSFNMPSEHV
jgi:hypothetical protein